MVLLINLRNVSKIPGPSRLSRFLLVLLQFLLKLLRRLAYVFLGSKEQHVDCVEYQSTSLYKNNTCRTAGVIIIISLPRPLSELYAELSFSTFRHVAFLVKIA